ncbi:hypothetical protein Tcan_01415, partial [Toxocara canis]
RPHSIRFFIQEIILIVGPTRRYYVQVVVSSIILPRSTHEGVKPSNGRLLSEETTKFLTTGIPAEETRSKKVWHLECSICVRQRRIYSVERCAVRGQNVLAICHPLYLHLYYLVDLCVHNATTKILQSAGSNDQSMFSNNLQGLDA